MGEIGQGLLGGGERARLVSKLRPGDLMPKSPDREEPSIGETVCEAAERMAKTYGIGRDEQDAFTPPEPLPRRPGLRGTSTTSS